MNLADQCKFILIAVYLMVCIVKDGYTRNSRLENSTGSLNLQKVIPAKLPTFTNPNKLKMAK